MNYSDYSLSFSESWDRPDTESPVAPDMPSSDPSTTSGVVDGGQLTSVSNDIATAPVVEGELLTSSVSNEIASSSLLDPTAVRINDNCQSEVRSSLSMNGFLGGLLTGACLSIVIAIVFGVAVVCYIRWRRRHRSQPLFTSKKNGNHICQNAETEHTTTARHYASLDIEIKDEEHRYEDPKTLHVHNNPQVGLKTRSGDLETEYDSPNFSEGPDRDDGLQHPYLNMPLRRSDIDSGNGGCNVTSNTYV